MDLVPILSLLVFLPSLGAVLIFCIPSEPERTSKNVKNASLFISMATFCIAFMLWGFFEPELQGYQFVEKYEWWSPLGITYAVGVDGISLAYILIVTSCVPLLCCFTPQKSTADSASNYLLFLVLETCLLGALCSLDLTVFYIFAEAALIPTIFMLASPITRLRKKLLMAAILWSSLTSMIFLGALLFLLSTLYSSFVPEILVNGFSYPIQVGVWGIFFLYFFLKLFLYPLYVSFSHGAHEKVSRGDIFGGVGLMILGFYGMVRFVISLFPRISMDVAPWVQGGLLLGILFGSVWVLSKGVLSKVLPIVLLLQVGMSLFALFLGSPEGLVGGIFFAVNQAILWIAILVCLEVTYRKTDFLEKDKGQILEKNRPILVFFFILFCLSSIGFPGTSGFLGIFLIMIGVFSTSTLMAILLAISLVLMTISFLYSLKIRFLKSDANELWERVEVPLQLREILLLSIMAIGVVSIGIFPSVVTDLIQPPIHVLVARTQSIDSANYAVEPYGAALLEARPPFYQERSKGDL